MIRENTLGLTNQTYSPQLRDDPPGTMKKGTALLESAGIILWFAMLYIYI